MKILVFGRSGQVARELQRRAGPGVAITALGREEVDLEDPASCTAAVRDHAADAIINAAAYTAVDQAEEEEPRATRINAAAPGAMARAAAKISAPFLHISTDYVFAGGGTAPWCPHDPTGPLGAYGRSKLAGEEAVRGARGCHVILRTSWVFSAHGSNFVKTMLRLGAERDVLRVVNDQVGGPTPAAAIADALLKMARALATDPGRTGTYHYTGAPETTWAEFARAIFHHAHMNVTVRGLATADYPTLARRPLNSRLDCRETETVFGLKRPDWRRGLQDVLQELMEDGG